MRASFVVTGLLVAAASMPVHAQGRRGAAGASDHAVSTARLPWQQISGYIAQAAEDMPAEKYSYKPTPEVRSFGQLVAHVAGSQYMFCAAALGEKERAEDDVEKSKTAKDDIVAAMKASNEYCARAYRLSDAATRAPLTMFGTKATRLFALVVNATHDGEHYGNIVTYLRMNGMVPPSSRGQ
ncbi:MAG: DinB family protein [Gemmatimonadales bacterium]|nr:DinB family protein [Gemmatimonadales bacterium]